MSERCRWLDALRLARSTPAVRAEAVSDRPPVRRPRTTIGLTFCTLPAQFSATSSRHQVSTFSDAIARRDGDAWTHQRRPRASVASAASHVGRRRCTATRYGPAPARTARATRPTQRPTQRLAPRTTNGRRNDAAADVSITGSRGLIMRKFTALMLPMALLVVDRGVRRQQVASSRDADTGARSRAGAQRPILRRPPAPAPAPTPTPIPAPRRLRRRRLRRIRVRPRLRWIRPASPPTR